MKTTQNWARALGVLASVSVLAACTFGASDDESDPDFERPSVEDVSGRQAVPTITLLTKTAASDPTRFEVSRLVVESWKAAGIPAELKPVDDAEMNLLITESKNYDVDTFSYGPTTDRLDPENLLGRFFSGNATEKGTNVSLYKSERYDAAYKAQTGAEDAATRLQAVKEAQQILNDDLPAVPIFYPKVGGAFRSDRWTGIEGGLGNPVFNMWNATNATPTGDEDTLVVGTTAEPQTLNPVTAAVAESQIPISLLYDTPLAIGLDGETVNRAADDVDVQGTTITLHVREGMTFSDGQPVTSQDVAFSLEYLKDKQAPLFAGGLEVMTSARASGQNVEITLAKPTAHFVDVSLTQVPILPEHVWSSKDPASISDDSPVGSGPFTLTERNIGSSIRFAANKTHYDPPKISELEMVVLGGPDAGIGGIESGELDLFDDQQPVAVYEPLKELDEVTVIETQSHGWRGLHFNMSREPMDDLKFRQALTALIPFEEIIEVVMQGDAEVGGSVIAPVLEDWHNDDVAAFAYDPAAAMKALEDAGYAFGPDDKLYYPAPDDDRRERQVESDS